VAEWALSDIALKRVLPEDVAKSVAAYVGCIAGAILIDDYRNGLLAAGFEHVEIVDSGADLNAYAKVENQSGCCSRRWILPIHSKSSRSLAALLLPSHQVPCTMS